MGIADLGGSPLIISTANSQLGGKETPSDTARVLERMVSAIVWRTYGQAGLEEMAAGTTVPVVNALSDDFHPCQLLADLLTIREHKGTLAGLTRDVPRRRREQHGAVLRARRRHRGHARAHRVTRRSTRPRPPSSPTPTAIAEPTGGSVTLYTDAAEAAAGADVIVTDTWVSMGKEDEKAQRVATFGAYRVDADLMALAAPDAIFMHCLPADRGYEVTADVIDGEQSVIWDEAENRLHAQKALLVWLLARKDA